MYGLSVNYRVAATLLNVAISKFLTDFPKTQTTFSGSPVFEDIELNETATVELTVHNNSDQETNIHHK